ncbi:hypothetical protein D3C72_1950900 [compost metagenome]
MAPGADRVAIAGAHYAVGVGDADDRRLLADKALDRIDPLHLGFQVDHHQVDAHDAAHDIISVVQANRLSDASGDSGVAAMLRFWLNLVVLLVPSSTLATPGRVSPNCRAAWGSSTPCALQRLWRSRTLSRVTSSAVA